MTTFNFLLRLMSSSRRRTQSGHLGLNVGRDIAVHKFGSDADRILDCVHIRRSVRDETRALDSKQWRATVFSVINPLLEIRESASREQVADLAGNRRRQGFLQCCANQI